VAIQGLNGENSSKAAFVVFGLSVLSFPVFKPPLNAFLLPRIPHVSRTGAPRERKCRFFRGAECFLLCDNTFSFFNR